MSTPPKEQWKKDRSDVLAQIEGHIENGDHNAALSLIKEYDQHSSDDDEFLELIRDAENLKSKNERRALEHRIQKLEKSIDSSDGKHKTDQLIKIDPDNAKFRKEIVAIKEEEKRHKEENDARDKREKQIKGQFSSWDGSHIATVKYIKKNMKDPSSYKHVSTKYWDRKDHLIVIVNYRGKNSFGGVVPGWVKVRVNIDGSDAKVIETNESISQ